MLKFERLNDGWAEIAKDTKRAEYLKKYVTEYSGGREVSIIIEEDYVDRDYLIDYSCYYARCFEDIGKKVKRVHFIQIEKDDLETSFQEYLGKPDQDHSSFIAKLKDCYIGFTTIKPIQKRSLGRTILKPYPQDDGNGKQRHFPVYNRYQVNLAGIDIELESIPYQEQDRNVAACATTAIWSALGGLARVFDCAKFQSQYDITRLAFESFGNLGGRMFPNEGLSSNQILNMLTDVGYDPIFYNISNWDNYFIDNLIISYLDMGIPLLAELHLQKDVTIHGKPEVDTTGHLVVILGYKCQNGQRSIDELYIHDDQIGCYSKVSFNNGNHLSWVNEWTTDRGFNRLINVSIIAPVYHKIRIPFNSVYTLVRESFKSITPQQIEIELLTIQMYRSYIVQNKSSFDVYNTINIDRKPKEISFQDLLTMSLPKYLWCAKVSIGEVVIHLMFDSTSYLLEPLIVSSSRKPD